MSLHVFGMSTSASGAAEEQQKVALITGSSSGIGKAGQSDAESCCIVATKILNAMQAVAQRLAAEGYRVVVNSRRPKYSWAALGVVAQHCLA